MKEIFFHHQSTAHGLFDKEEVVHYEYTSESKLSPNNITWNLFTVSLMLYIYRTIVDSLWHCTCTLFSLSSSFWQHTGLCKGSALYICSCYFFLFSKLKIHFKYKWFKDIDDIQRNTIVLLHTIPKEEFQRCFNQWENCWYKYVWL